MIKCGEPPKTRSILSTVGRLLGVAVACIPAVWEAASAADEIHWTIMGEGSVAFSWRGDESEVRYGLTSAYGQRAAAQAPSPRPFSSSGPFREALLTGLRPDSLYHYAIGNGPDRTFRTPPPRGASGFTVCAEGDIGDSTSYFEMPIVQSQVAIQAPDFVIALGDLTYGNVHGQEVVDQHFNDVMVWSETAAYMPAWGNHEYDIPSEDDLRNYKGRFDLPNDRASPGSPSVSCCGEDWYWFDYGNVRFIAYPEPWAGAWEDWNVRAAALMAEAQADPALSFIVTFGHRPAYSSGHHPGSSILRGYLDALGAAYSKYVMNLNGHSHNYERSHPQNGVTHVTAGTGGASLEQDGSCLWRTCSQPSWSAFRAMRLGPLRLRFSSTSIEGAFLCGPAGGGVNDVACVEDDVVDAFVIGTPRDDDCDGLDDDGDGEPDEDYRAVATSCGVGACAAIGRTACVNGHVVDDCAPGAPAAVDASCDGMDEDCDGRVDEDHIPAEITCGVGACSGQKGPAVCQAGREVVDCDPLAGASPETCDMVDNDCDGSVDEDFGVGGPCEVISEGCSVRGAMVCGPGGDVVVCDSNIISLTAAQVGARTLLAWEPLFKSGSYDLVRGDLGALAASAGDFTVATRTCLAENTRATRRADVATPAPGQGYWYLVRGNGCGMAAYDTVELGRVGDRTGEIDSSEAGCRGPGRLPQRPWSRFGRPR